jgi:hypothetical protein
MIRDEPPDFDKDDPEFRPRRPCRHVSGDPDCECCDDENGERLFQEEDTFPLGGKSAAALDRIFTVAQRLNGLRDEDVQELAKNSYAGQSDASPSA